MSYSIKIASEAELDIKNAQNWYSDKSPELAERFTAVIKHTIDALTSTQVEHMVAFKDLRRVLVRTFPYVIYYRRNEEARIINILAILHNKQSAPNLLKARKT